MIFFFKFQFWTKIGILPQCVIHTKIFFALSALVVVFWILWLYPNTLFFASEKKNQASLLINSWYFLLCHYLALSQCVVINVHCARNSFMIHFAIQLFSFSSSCHVLICVYLVAS